MDVDPLLLERHLFLLKSLLNGLQPVVDLLKGLTLLQGLKLIVDLLKGLTPLQGLMDVEPLLERHMFLRKDLLNGLQPGVDLLKGLTQLQGLKLIVDLSRGSPRCKASWRSALFSSCVICFFFRTFSVDSNLL